MKNKITDLNIKQVKPKDSHFKEFKITYKYKGKPISDFRVFDKNISKTNDELLKTVTKEINDNLENGKLAKYALKFTGFTSILIALICAFMVVGIGVGVGTYFAVQPKSIAKEVKVDVPTIEGLTFKNKQAYVGQDYSTEISIDITKTGENRLPDELKSVKSGNRTITNTEYIYDVVDNKETADFKIPGKYVEGDIKIDLELVKPTPPGPTTPWYLDNDYLNNLTPDDVIKENPDGSIGVVQTLKVNGLEHRVRLIGVDKDYGTIGDESTKIHTTWEFANLISDENGNSLATQWNDTNDNSTANFKYDESTIHNALNGENVNNVLWAQKEETTWSSDYKCSVLDMLNEGNPGLVDVLKAPSKYININDSGWDEQTVNDKLFLLSPVEMGRTSHQFEETKTSAYSYYEDGHNADRIKKQVNNEEAYIGEPQINDSGSGQLFEGTVTNYAGYNSSAGAAGKGGISWLRSPNTFYSSYAWGLSAAGSFIDRSAYVYAVARAVAPAFCI